MINEAYEEAKERVLSASSKLRQEYKKMVKEDSIHEVGDSTHVADETARCIRRGWQFRGSGAFRSFNGHPWMDKDNTQC